MNPNFETGMSHKLNGHALQGCRALKSNLGGKNNAGSENPAKYLIEFSLQGCNGLGVGNGLNRFVRRVGSLDQRGDRKLATTCTERLVARQP